MAYQKLYLNDSLLFNFAACILELSQFEGKNSLILDRSAFYAEAGGQLADRGTLTIERQSFPVVDVQCDNLGRFHHILEQSVAEISVGNRVWGEVDGLRRRDFMSQHTGQHLLSSAVFQLAGAETISSRLGSKSNTLDLNLELTTEQICEAEKLVNQIIMEDRPIRRLYPTAEELEQLALRKKPVVAEQVRLIEIADFDLTACGGTHCERTGQIGALRVLSTERYKNLFRLNFVSGMRTVKHSLESDALLKLLNQEFGCHPSEIPQVVQKLREDLRQAREDFGKLRAEQMRLKAEALWADNPATHENTIVSIPLEKVDLAYVRAFAKTLCQRADFVALIHARDAQSGEWMLVAERGQLATFDIGAWFKQLARAHNGRGGGPANRAEGRFPAELDLSALLQNVSES